MVRNMPFVYSKRGSSQKLFRLLDTDPAQPWGRGLINDFKTTIGTHWLSEMTNFNQKTVAVSLLMFITVVAPTLTFGKTVSATFELSLLA